MCLLGSGCLAQGGSWTTIVPSPADAMRTSAGAEIQQGVRPDPSLATLLIGISVPAARHVAFISSATTRARVRIDGVGSYTFEVGGARPATFGIPVRPGGPYTLDIDLLDDWGLRVGHAAARTGVVARGSEVRVLATAEGVIRSIGLTIADGDLVVGIPRKIRLAVAGYGSGGASGNFAPGIDLTPGPGLTISGASRLLEGAEVALDWDGRDISSTEVAAKGVDRSNADQVWTSASWPGVSARITLSPHDPPPASWRTAWYDRTSGQLYAGWDNVFGGEWEVLASGTQDPLVDPNRETSKVLAGWKSYFKFNPVEGTLYRLRVRPLIPRAGAASEQLFVACPTVKISSSHNSGPFVRRGGIVYLRGAGFRPWATVTYRLFDTNGVERYAFLTTSDGAGASPKNWTVPTGVTPTGVWKAEAVYSQVDGQAYRTQRFDFRIDP